MHDFLPNMNERKCKICFWLQFVIVIHLHVQNPEFCLRMSKKSNMADIQISRWCVQKLISKKLLTDPLYFFSMFSFDQSINICQIPFVWEKIFNIIFGPLTIDSSNYECQPCWISFDILKQNSGFWTWRWMTMANRNQKHILHFLSFMFDRNSCILHGF